MVEAQRLVARFLNYQSAPRRLCTQQAGRVFGVRLLLHQDQRPAAIRGSHAEVTRSQAPLQARVRVAQKETPVRFSPEGWLGKRPGRWLDNCLVRKISLPAIDPVSIRFRLKALRSDNSPPGTPTPRVRRVRRRLPPTTARSGKSSASIRRAGRKYCPTGACLPCRSASRSWGGCPRERENISLEHFEVFAMLPIGYVRNEPGDLEFFQRDQVIDEIVAHLVAKQRAALERGNRLHQ